jgi:hypothetical protein
MGDGFAEGAGTDAGTDAGSGFKLLRLASARSAKEIKNSP